MKVSTMLMPALLAACATITPRGQLQVLLPTTIQRDDGNDRVEQQLEPGRYAARVTRASRRRLAFEIPGAGSADFEIELNDGVESFPTNGGLFNYPPEAHNQDFGITGEFIPAINDSYQRSEYRRCTIDIFYERICSQPDSDGNVECRTVERRIYGRMLNRYTLVSQAFDIGITFMQPDRPEVIARYSESLPVETRRVNERRGPCLRY